MREFLKEHSYLVLWISSLAIVGTLAFLIFELNGWVPSSDAPEKTNPSSATSGTGSPSVPAPSQPSITLTIQKTPTGNSLVIQWHNLPDGTVMLDIYRGKTGTDPSTWLLWKTESIAGQNLSGGSLQIDLNGQDENGYSFSISAESSTSGNSNTSTLWQSSTTVPMVTTSTSENPGTPSQSSPGSPTSTNPTTNPMPTSSNQNSPSSGPSSTTTPTSTPTPTGTPYYNPKVQIETYGSDQSGNFWVQHVDQKIQIGWQNLPPGTTAITVTRSQNQDGPWVTFLTQENPGTTGSYAIQLVDGTLNDSYYYEMAAFNGSTTIATYGPIYLAGQ